MENATVSMKYLIPNLVYTIATLIIVSGFSSFFESSSRITEYTIFTYPRIVEGLWDTLEKLNLVKAIPFARQLIFALSVATALVIYKNKKEEMPNSYQKFINMVFGKNLFSWKINLYLQTSWKS